MLHPVEIQDGSISESEKLFIRVLYDINLVNNQLCIQTQHPHEFFFNALPSSARCGSPYPPRYNKIVLRLHG